MRKKLALAAAAAALLAAFDPTGSAQARCDQGGPTTGHSDQVVLPGTGSHIYTNGGSPADPSGYGGIHGSIGYIEADGNRTTTSGSIEGGSNDGSVNGKIWGDPSGIHVCANDTAIL